MFIDLHTHTYPNSDDSFLSPDELIEGAKSKGLDGICITEHDYFWEPEDIKSLSERHEFLVLPGCEINTDSGHVLVFGLRDYVFGMHKVEFLCRLVEQAGGAMIAAHPYRRRYLTEQAGNPDSYSAMLDTACQDKLFTLCHGIEAVNGRAGYGETAFAHDLADRLGVSKAGGSDSHRQNHLGTAATQFRRAITCLDDLIGEIRAARFEPVSLNTESASPALLQRVEETG